MKKSIRLLGTTLLVTGMGIGGTALTAGAASAATGTQSVTVQASSLDVTGRDRGSDNRHCRCNDHNDRRGDWKDGHGRGHGDDCRDDGHGRGRDDGHHDGKNGDHHDGHGDWKDGHGDWKRNAV
jgi:hypothetical protein